MQPLLRPAFHPEAWDADRLDAAADFWLSLCDIAPVCRGLIPRHRTELLFRGFSRCRADAVESSLVALLEAAGFPVARVTRPDPDTITIGTDFLPDGKHPPAGLGVPALDKSEAVGMYVEVRFTAAGFQAGAKQSKADGTLVLAGQLVGDKFEVRTLWQVGPAGWGDRAYSAAKWAKEDVWRAEFRDWVARGADFTTVKMREIAGEAFVGRRTDQVSGWVNKMLFAQVDGRPRLGRVLTRFALWGGVTVAVAVPFAYLPSNLLYLRWILIPPGLLGLFGLGTNIFVECLLLVKIRSAMRWLFGELYAEPVSHLPAEPEEVTAVCDNPYARKYAAELEGLGFRHAGDIRINRSHLGRVVTRVYLGPDGTTTASMIVTTLCYKPGGGVNGENWPADVNLQFTTRFTDGSHFSTINAYYGWRKKRFGPEVGGQVFPAERDIPDLFARHGTAAERFAAERGTRPIPHTTFADLLRFCDDHGERERQLYVDFPCTWLDALYFAQYRVRRDYRG